MINIRIGFDLDGTLCSMNIPVLRMVNELKGTERYKTLEEFYYKERKPLLDARFFLSESDEMYVITSRPEHLRKITEKWIKHYFPKATLIIVNQSHFREGETDIISWCKIKAQKKAEVLNKLGIDIYFDDESEVLQYFRGLCPKCKIIKYGGRIEDGEESIT